MGTVNLYRGLDSERETLGFNGRLRDNLDLDWEHAKILKNGKILDPDYELKENDVIIIQDIPGAVSTALLVTSIVLGVVSIGVGIGTGIYAYNQAKKAREEMEAAMGRVGKSNKQKDISSIPQLGDARNEKADGKNAPVILGRHLFAPYYLSEPYMRPEGADGEDLYWYGTFLAGQSGLCFEKIRNGTVDLVTFPETDIEPQRGEKFFNVPENYNDPANGRYIIKRFPAAGTYGSNSNMAARAADINNFFGDAYPTGRTYPVDEGAVNGQELASITVIPDSGGTILEFKTSGGAAFRWQGVSPSGASFWFQLKRENPNFIIPPFYTPENFIDIVQKGNEGTLNEFSAPVFEQKWADSLDSTVELSRKKKDGARTVNENGAPDQNGIYMEDEGEEPVERPTARFPMRAEIEIFFAEGLYSWDSVNGVETYAAVNIELSWSKDRVSWTPFSGDEWKYKNLRKNRSAQMRFLAEIDFPASVYTKSGDPVFIRAVRKTRIHTGTYRSRAYLSAIRTKQYNPNTSSNTQLKEAKNINGLVADKFCRLGIKVKANKNTQEFLDRFNILVSMTGRVALGDWTEGRWSWNGRWSPAKVKTSNSAAVLLELITGLIHEPSRHKDSELDLRTFGKLYEFCMNRSVETDAVDINGKPGIQRFALECNGVLTSGTRKIDAVNSVLATCDGGIYIDEFGKLEVYYEDTQITPVALLNRQRIVEMIDQRSLERKTDGYTVEFIDQDSDFVQITHRILRPDIEVKPGENTYSPMKLDFTTSYYQAMWHARRLLAKEEHRPGELKTTVGKEGRYYKPGSLIKVQNERFKIGLGSGEIVQLVRSGNKITGLKLMERFDISSERDYWIEYYVVDGDRNHVVTKQIQSVGQFTDVLTFTAPIDMNSPDVPAFGNILSAMYAEGLNTGRIWEARRYIVTGLSENELGYDMTLAEYAEDIYRTGKIEERRSSILNAPPMVLADQQRLEQQAFMDAIRVQTSPPFISSIARDAAAQAVAANAPRFRGVYYVAGLPDGTINGDRMNLNDWVFFAKGGTGGWQEQYVYQWTATGWEIRPRPSQNPAYGWLYLDAVSSIAEGTPVGVFSDIFCEALTTNTIFVKYLFMQQATIRENGNIQSAKTDPVTGKPLLLINENGIEAIKAILRDLTVINGNFQNITVDQKSTFLGNIESGPLYASNEVIAPPAGTTFNSNTTIATIRSTLNIPSVNLYTFNTTGGSFGSTQGLAKLTFTKIVVGYYNTAAGPNTGTLYGYKLEIIFNDGTTYTFQDRQNPSALTDIIDGRINQTLVVGGGAEGQTLRFNNLPTGAGSYPAGTVYRDSAGYLRIV